MSLMRVRRNLREGNMSLMGARRNLRAQFSGLGKEDCFLFLRQVSLRLVAYGYGLLGGDDFPLRPGLSQGFGAAVTYGGMDGGIRGAEIVLRLCSAPHGSETQTSLN